MIIGLNKLSRAGEVLSRWRTCLACGSPVFQPSVLHKPGMKVHTFNHIAQEENQRLRFFLATS